MRHGLTGLFGTLLFASATAMTGCSDGSTEETPAGGGGSGGTGGGGTDVTTLAASATLSTLTPADTTKLCDDTYAYFRTAIPTATGCKWKGLSFATSSSAPTQEQLRANCTEKETGCMADPVTAFASNPGCSPPPANCGATVAEYSTCIRDQVAFFNQTVNAIENCAVLTSTGTDAVWAALGSNPPASCSFAACPGLFPPNPLY
jgi:hypothetical protein